MWPYVVGALGAAAIGAFGQEKANDTNVMLSERSMAFNAEQAQLNRDFSAQQAENQMKFQRRMSNTSYQRAINDMEQAGLNPMLAYSQGGSSTPGGAAGAGSSASSSPAHVENEMLPVSSAVQIGMQMAQIKKVEAETENVRAQTQTELERPTNVRQQTSESVERVVNLQATTDRIAEQNALTRAQVEKVKAEAAVVREQQGIAAANMMLKRFELMLKELDFPQAIAEAKAWASDYGQEVRPYVRDFQGGASGAGSVMRMLEPYLRGRSVRPLPRR